MNPKLDWSMIASKRTVKNLYERGLSIEKLAERLGVAKSVLQRKMVEWNIERRPPAHQLKNRNSIHKRILATAGQENLSWKELAEKFNCSISTVNRARTEFHRRKEEENV